MFWKKGKQGEVPTGTADDAPTTSAGVTTTDEQQQQESSLEQVKTTATQDIVYPSGLKLAVLMIAVFTSMFLVSLDRLIVSTAIPQITDEFHSYEDIGWYGSAYLLTNCCFQLLFGKFYTFFSVKYTLLSTTLLFEVGSALCGAAPSSTAFIVGRAIAGIGSAGIMSGVIVTLVYAVPLHKRPMYQGMFGAVFGVASVIGPLLGGAFTTNVTWRWCFYINLPFGGVAMVLIWLLLEVPHRDTTNLPLGQKLMQLDALGTFFLLPGIICLLLALQWGGLTYPWSDGRIIALLTLGGVLLVGFVLVQAFRPETATIPPRIFLQRSIIAGVWSTICIGGHMMIFVYYLPIWFQAITDVDAIESGIRLLPMILPMVVASILAGILISRIGYYTPFMIFGCCLLAVGSGLLTTLEVDMPQARWIGYQVIYGFGMGNTFQAPNLAAQAVLPNRDVPIGTSLMLFSQLLSGSVFISVGQNVLNNQLLQRLSNVPGFNPAMLSSNGATTLIQILPASVRPLVLSDYNAALRQVFQVGLILACLNMLGALALEWRSVKKNLKPAGGDVEAKPEGEGAAAPEKGSPRDDDDGEDAAERSHDAELDEEKVNGGAAQRQEEPAEMSAEMSAPDTKA